MPREPFPESILITLSPEQLGSESTGIKFDTYPAGTGEDTADPGYISPDQTGADTADPGYISQSTSVAPTQTQQREVPNPLHDYESYSYNLSWHILPPDAYNNLMANPGSAYVPTNCLVASAGKNSSSYQSGEITFGRNPAFNEDFYFADFKIDTYINTSKHSRTSNAYHINFTIIEPNGFTLINRLLEASEKLGIDNYLKTPYLIMIEFRGYTDGIPSMSDLANHVKHIPIVLVGFSSKLTSRGTEYQIEAAPYNHSAFNTTVVTTPATFKIKGSTVQELFGSGTPDTQATLANTNEVERAESILNDPNSGANDRKLAQQLLASSTKEVSSYVTGLTDGLNGWLQSLANESSYTRYPSRYTVIFDKEIGDATFAKFTNVTNAATSDSKFAGAKSSANLPVGQIVFNSNEFIVPPGVNILSLIDYAVRNSTYITDQLADGSDPNGNVKEFKLLKDALKWYRVIPSIQIGQYDSATKRYQYFITYHVRKWTTNTKMPYANQGRAAGWVKKYNYLFTGKNKDVISCNIDFDMLFFTQLTAHARKSQTGDTASAVKDQSDTTTPAIPTDKLQPVAISYVANNATTASMPGASLSAANKIRGGDTSRDLTQSSRGDMININLKIIGDPSLIKQDDIFYNQNLNENNSQILPNGSIVADDGELYVFLEFMSPTDYGDNTGLAIPGAALPGQTSYQYSSFRGVYKIITVENTFINGKFEQVLNLARLPISDEVRDTAINIENRNDSLISSGLGQLTPLPSASFTGPQILGSNLARIGALANPAQLANMVSSAAKGVLQKAAGAASASLLTGAISAAKEKLKSDSETGSYDEIISTGYSGSTYDET